MMFNKNNKVMVVEEEVGVGGRGGGEFEHLAEGCIANILSFTSPQDACVLSLVSSSFRSAALSDVVWERFLPSNYRHIISQSSKPTLTYSSNKDLYLYLCHNPLFLDAGQKSFALDKFNGKTCYMLSARSLSIVWGDTPRYWRWTSVPAARFSEVAELVSVCWLEIKGGIKRGMLSPNTFYGAYLVFKQRSGGAYGFEKQPVEVEVEGRRRTVYLEEAEKPRRRPREQIVPGILSRVRSRFLDAAPTPAAASGSEYPKERCDGWMEVELGDFFNVGGEDKEVEIAVYEVKSGGWKAGILVQGFELRPKHK